ncbi:hypothetical protein PG984_011596 [Apiospora sp. TS-2023a]
MTIHRLLLFPDPIINNENEYTSKGTSWKSDFIKVSDEHMFPWYDFTEKNVNSMFGDFLRRKCYPFDSSSLEVLYQSLRKVQGIPEERKAFIIDSESSLNDMFKESIVETLTLALERTAKQFQKRVNSRPPLGISTKFEGIRIPHPRNKNSLKRPDWPFWFVNEPPKSASKEPNVPETNLPKPKARSELAKVLVPTNEEEVGIALIGEAKRQYVFDPVNLHEEVNERQKVRVTLGQVMMYCHYAETRYAFVFNSEDVTFLRFFKLNEGRRFGVHFAILPWKRSRGLMSAWKGIWALVMLSLHDKHRPIVTQDHIVDLNDWSRFEENGEVLWVNHLSKVVIGDGEWAEGFRNVQASRDEFAVQLDGYDREEFLLWD